MAEGVPEYEELKLRIHDPDSEGCYRVRAEGPDGSVGHGTFASPFTETELDNFILRVGAPRRGVRGFHSPQMERAKEFGASLFQALIAESAEVREVYVGSRRVAESQDRGLRVTLYLSDAPRLMEIPWEFLYDEPSFLSQSIYTPLVRSLDLTSALQPRKVTLPLQILGMVSQPAGLATLDVEEEREKLEEALSGPRAQGLIKLCWLEGGTLSELAQVVGEPFNVHVFHYIGHGAYDERGEGGILILEDDRGEQREVTGDELGPVLYDEHSLRLVVLNSCEGARASHVDPFSGVASSLLRHRIPAVLAMQFEVTDEAAKIFAGRLYTALAQGFPIDASLAHARKAIFAAGNDVEFGTPVLFLRATDATLFEVEEGEREGTDQEEGVVAVGEGDFSVGLDETGMGDEVTWKLTVVNTGACELLDVSARNSDGEPLGEAVALHPRQRHVIRWADPDPERRDLITVTVRDAGGSRISEQVVARASVLEQLERGTPPPPRARVLIGGMLVAGLTVLIARLVADPIRSAEGATEASLIATVILRRTVTLAVLGGALGIWLSLVRGNPRLLANYVLLGLGLGALAGVLGGAIVAVPQYLPELGPVDDIRAISVGAFAVSGALIGALLGKLWDPRSVATGFLVGLASGALVRLFWNAVGSPGGSTFDEALGVGIQWLLIVGLVVAALQMLTGQLRSATLGGA